MNIYPFIGQNKYGQKGLIYGYGKGVYAHGCKYPAITGKKMDQNFAKPSRYKNITTEYLANTYGEVKSKEHAEFIVKLAEVNGFVASEFSKSNFSCAKWFSFKAVNGAKRLSLLKCYLSLNFNDGERKQITIPLPPELDCKESKPKKVLSNGAVYELHDDGMYCRNNHHDNCTVSFNFASLETLKKASDFKVVEGESDQKEEGTMGDVKLHEKTDREKALELMHELYLESDCDFYGFSQNFVDKISLIERDGEWPKVGDEVLLDGKKGIVKLPPDAQCYYVVAVDGIYTQCKFGELSKPKTPEEELMGELHSHFDKYTFTDQAINELPLKFNITKKPQ